MIATRGDRPHHACFTYPGTHLCPMQAWRGLQRSTHAMHTLRSPGPEAATHGYEQWKNVLGTKKGCAVQVLKSQGGSPQGGE